jgi:hypothetical protein
MQIVTTADMRLADEGLRHGPPPPGPLDHLVPRGGVVRNLDLGEVRPLAGEQGLRSGAGAAPALRVDGDGGMIGSRTVKCSDFGPRGPSFNVRVLPARRSRGAPRLFATILGQIGRLRLASASGSSSPHPIDESERPLRAYTVRLAGGFQGARRGEKLRRRLRGPSDHRGGGPTWQENS